MLSVKLIPQVINVFPEAPAIAFTLIFADGNVINLFVHNCWEIAFYGFLEIMASFNVTYS